MDQTAASSCSVSVVVEAVCAAPVGRVGRGLMRARSVELHAMRRLFTLTLLLPLLLAAACSSGDGSVEVGAAPSVAGANRDAGALKGPVSEAVSDAAPPSVVPQYAGGATGFSHFVFESLDGEVITSLVEGPRGKQVRVPLSYQALTAMLASGDDPPAELQMTRQDLARLVAQLDAVREGADKYRDINMAIADGYIQTTGVVPNMGAHFNNPGRIRDGAFNPAEPEILIYKKDSAGDWELTGTSFVLPRQLVGDDHPEGFAGVLDNWHVHYALCLGRTSGERTASETECAKSGGTFIESYGWMIHAWVFDDNPMGVFSMWNPNVPPFVSEQSLIDARTLRPSDLPANSTFVSIENFGHATINIEVGSTVIWENTDGVPHTVTGGSGGVRDGTFDSGLAGPGQTFTRRFDVAGTYAFTCTVHPAMNGTVIVGDGKS